MPTAPDIAVAANALLNDRTEHIPRSVAEQVNGGTIAQSNALAGQMRVHRFEISDAASGDSDITLTRKARVVRCHGIKTGGAGAASNTYTLKNSTTAITNAIDGNVADKAVMEAGTIDDASFEVSAGGTLRLSWAKSGGNVAAHFYVTVIYVD